MWWGCCRSGSCTALHRFGDVHTPWCWAEGHQLSPVRLERHSLPAGYTAVCVFTGGKQHSSIQLNSLHTCVIPLLQQWVVSWPEQMCHWNQTPSLARTPQGSGQACRGWCMATCSSNTIPVATAYTRCSVCPAHKSLLSSRGPFALCIFRCVAPSCQSAFTFPPLLPGKGEAEEEYLTHLVLCHHDSSLWLPARMVLYWEWAGCWHG